MKPTCIALASLLAVIAIAPAHGAEPPAGRDPEALRQALAAAQAGATRPGDDALDCAQLQQELMTTTTDPALQAQVQSMGAQAQKNMDAMQAAQADVARGTSTTAAGAMVPGASGPAFAAAVADAEAAKARGAARMQERIASTDQITAMMPQMMRGQRVIDLARARRCDWVEQVDGGAEPVPARP
ncbi:MAG: hypothetical protein EOP90_03810 [Lysobacteraceae bacterium]|nr:MAG: hypothetical protein EOP90_03810 [Xanthomonadaceae bacterium]